MLKGALHTSNSIEDKENNNGNRNVFQTDNSYLEEVLEGEREMDISNNTDVSINHLKQHKTKKSYVKIAPMGNQPRSQQTVGPFQQAEFEDRELEILEELIYTEHTLAEEANSRTNKRNQKNKR